MPLPLGYRHEETAHATYSNLAFFYVPGKQLKTPFMSIYDREAHSMINIGYKPGVNHYAVTQEQFDKIAARTYGSMPTLISALDVATARKDLYKLLKAGKAEPPSRLPSPASATPPLETLAADAPKLPQP